MGVLSVEAAGHQLSAYGVDAHFHPLGVGDVDAIVASLGLQRSCGCGGDGVHHACLVAHGRLALVVDHRHRVGVFLAGGVVGEGGLGGAGGANLHSVAVDVVAREVDMALMVAHVVDEQGELVLAHAADGEVFRALGNDGGKLIPFVGGHVVGGDLREVGRLLARCGVEQLKRLGRVAGRGGLGPEADGLPVALQLGRYEPVVVGHLGVLVVAVGGETSHVDVA